MAILDKLPSSPLGLKGVKPATFDVNPAAALHNVYSVDGTPSVRWVSSNGNAGIIPQPSQLDELDVNAPKLKPVGVVSQVYKSRIGQTYRDLGPTEGRY
jgi:hypothetical protein